MPQIVEVNGSRIEFPDGMAAGEIEAAIKKNFLSIPAAKKESSTAGSLLAGAVRGAGSIGATLMAPLDAAARAAGIENSFIGRDDRRSSMDNALKTMGADTDSFAYGAGKIGAEIAGTAGVGGQLARGLAFAPKLASAVASGGMLAPGANMATRMAGGAITGGASAALVNPDDMAMGAGVGALLPPVIKGAGILGGKVAGKVNEAFLSDNATQARKIANIAGAKTSEEVEAIRAALATPRPSNIGVDLTVPQILQEPGVSQLQRSLQNIGDQTIGQRLTAQQRAMQDALNRVAPVGDSVQNVAQDAGSAIRSFATGNEAQASKRVGQLFESVDPFNETRFLLPIDAMQSQQAKYLGAGTFGMGDKASRALDVARGIGTETLEAVAPTKAMREQTLMQAVKQAGGINPKSLSSMGLSGEINDLKQMGLGRLTNASKGQSIDKLAESMHQRGFTPDDDPATLLDMLRGGGGGVAMGRGDNAFRRAYEGAMGDAPEAMTIAKPVNFQTVQNLRSSIGSAIDDLSSRAGRKNEIAALQAMKAEIDSAVNKVASGKGDPAEYFAKDMVDTWRQGLAAHEAKKLRFNTGPQSRLFARGGDGLPAAQGAEVPRLFFNSLRSQSDDAASFKRLIGGNTEIADELKRYITTSAAQNTDALGNLTNSKFNNWARSHSGGIGGLLSEPDQAVIREIGSVLDASDKASRLGMATGSNTMQNVNAALSSGLLENPMVNFMANRLPMLKAVAGPALDNLKDASRKKTAEKLGGLLADPEALNQALAEFLAMKSRNVTGLNAVNRARLAGAASKAAPVLIAQ
jgi:hypothetical protein